MAPSASLNEVVQPTNVTLSVSLQVATKPAFTASVVFCVSSEVNRGQILATVTYLVLCVAEFSRRL